MLAAAKRIKPAERSLHTSMSDYRAAHNALELDGTTLGLLGFGRIGSRVGRTAAALGMRVLTHDPYVDHDKVAGVAELVPLDVLWRDSHVISLHAPAVPETRHIINTTSLAEMRRGVIIVNCARGSLIDQQALLEALESGQVAGAGLDVTEPEPLPADHPLLHRDDVIVTPHIASSTTVGGVRLITAALDQAAQWLHGDTPEHLLDPTAANPAVDRRQTSKL